MRSDSKSAVVQRLQFAIAELEAVMGIAACEEELALLEDVRMLAERARQCIEAIHGRPAPPVG